MRMAKNVAIAKALRKMICSNLNDILSFVYIIQFYNMLFLFPNFVNGSYLVLMLEVWYQNYT
jgi:hypothetical protein